MHSVPVTTLVTAAVLASLTACSIPEKHITDATERPVGEPFGCLGDPPASTAKDPLTIAGTLIDSFHTQPLAGAAVEGFVAVSTTPFFTTTSDSTGRFSHSQGVGGVPLAAYVRASSNGYLQSYFYPATAIADDVDLTIQMLSAMDLATIVRIAGIESLEPGKVNMIVSVVDCNGNPVAGATVTTTPAGTVRYFANTAPSPTSIATDAKTGAALVANIPASNTTISATVSGMTLRNQVLDGVAGVLMQTEIRP